MFKSARWRNDKNKVKVVFKLQFHAAQLAKIGGESLIVSIVPADTGKPTVKSEKAVVREGRCLWEKPVYEAVKFNREPKSGKIHEKIYYFVVGTGQSKTGVVGEASIDFSSYAEATKISLVSLPLEKSQTEAVLNVSIQRIQETIDQRDFEECEEAKSNAKDNSLWAQFRNGDAHDTVKSNSDEDFQCKIPDAQISDLDRNRRPSSESDVTVSSSEGSSINETLWEPPMKNQEPKSDALKGIYDEHQSSPWEWLGNSAPEASTDDSSSTPRETFERQHSDVVADVMENLKAEVAGLSRQAEMSELELQTLRKQIGKECKRGQDLSREIVCLKDENEKLKAFVRRSDEKTHLHAQGGDSQALAQELRQELNHEKEVNVNLQIQLQKMQESNSQLILAVRDLDAILEQKDQEISNLSLIGMDKNSCESDRTYETDDEQKALEEIVKDHSGAKETYILEQQMMDLRGEIEVFRNDKDELELNLEQLALDYEIVKQENHELSFRLEQSQLQEQLKIQYECSPSYAMAHELESQIEYLENEMKIRSSEFSNSLVTISELEAHIKSLEEELERQAQRFEADLGSLTRAKVEQEQRAIRAEETLRKTRWQTANNAERLQEEFKRLSTQMASTFEANEKLATKSLAEANVLRVQKTRLEEMLRNASEELQSVKDYYEFRLHQLMSELVLFSDRIEQKQSEIKHGAMQLEEEKMLAKETQRLLSEEIKTLKDEIERMRKSLKEMESLVEKRNDEKAKLEGYLKEKEDEISTMEKMIMDINGRENVFTPLSQGNEETGNLKERVKLLEGQIMLKETTVETWTKTFSGRENDLLTKIKELEKALEMLSQKSSCSLENEMEKVAAAKETPNYTFSEKSRKGKENICNMIKTSHASDLETPSIKRCDAISSTAIKGSINDDEITNELEVLKERNRSMEEELKEMQDRYSEISLKFAEVEGERQQLVMKLRNLKNVRKSP